MRTIMDLITEYIDNIGNGYPIFTSDIHEYVLNEIKDAKPLVINEYINRYEKKHDNFIRYKKGIYYKCVDTVFGKTKIKYADLVKRLYIEDDKEIYGYETGPSLINNLGLTTQVPKYAYLATNKLQVDKVDDTIKLVKPVTKVTEKNYKYLQLLDIISNRFKVHIEVDDYNFIIRKEIDEMNLNFEQLLYYANLISTQQNKMAELNQKVQEINQFLKDNENISSDLFDEGDEIRLGLAHNKNIYSYYTIVGTEIPKKLWLTHLKLSDKTTIEGQADNLESVYAFFRSIKDYNPNSDIKLQKLGLASKTSFTPIEENVENGDNTNSQEFDTDSILTSLNADFYEFIISDDKNAGKSQAKQCTVNTYNNGLPGLEPINESN